MYATLLAGKPVSFVSFQSELFSFYAITNP